MSTHAICPVDWREISMKHAQPCTVFEALKDQLLMNLRMKNLYN